MEPLKISNYIIVICLTFLTTKTNNIKANPPSSSSTPVGAQRSKVQLSFKCNNLPNGDRFSKSDPFVVVNEQITGQLLWYKTGNTDRLRNNNDPTFTETVIITHIFEEKQPLKFDVYDANHDKNLNDLKKHTFLGSVEIPLGVLINKQNTQLELKNKKNQNSGTLIVTAKEYGVDKGKVTLGLSGLNLEKKNSYASGGGSDPYLEIYKCADDSTKKCELVKKTEYIKGNNKNPQWATFDIPVWSLCDGSYHRTLKFICWDYNFVLKDNYIGEFNVTLNELIERFHNTSTAAFKLTNHKKKNEDNKYSHSGEILVHTFHIGPNFTLIDYIHGGTQIHSVVSIDFTISNGSPQKKGSYHRIKPEKKDYRNIYEQAIWNVVSVIEDYDTDKQIPAFGFGGCFDGITALHKFNLNMSNNPDCNGVSGVLKAYRECLAVVELKAPTNFAPTIEHVVEQATNLPRGMGYYILLILTDGDVSDFLATKMAIFKASKLPISIIVVGVGGGNFSKMQTLAAKKKPLVDASGQSVRDIVHFVDFQGYANFNENIGFSPLAKDVLAEIPQQLLGYMELNKIEPKNKVTYQNYYIEN